MEEDGERKSPARKEVRKRGKRKKEKKKMTLWASKGFQGLGCNQTNRDAKKIARNSANSVECLARARNVVFNFVFTETGK